jgi:hypothetical protein
MRNRTTLAFAVAAFVAPLLGALLIAQGQPQPPAAPPSAQAGAPQGRQGGGAQGRQGGGPGDGVQVGVPAGRGGAPGGRGGRGGGRAAGPAAPAPRNAAGRVLLSGATPADKGVWIGGSIGQREDAVLQPWAKAIIVDRNINELEPHTRCKASGVSRPFMTPYGVEIVELADAKRIYMFDIGGPHTFRTIYMDGRSHPKNLTPTYYGHSIGWWEGDTLVIDTKGFVESFWMDRGDSPHTEMLHTVERLTRTDAVSIRYDLTVDDPGAYTKPWTATMNLRWSPGVELFEYICQQQNYAHELMVGAAERVDRTTITVP